MRMPRRPQKRTAERRRQQPQSLIAIDPLVGPGNPPHRHPPCPKTDQSRQHHCMVSLATCTSSPRSESAHQTKYATVMLSFNIWLPMRNGWTRSVFVSQARAEHLGVVPSDAFAANGAPPEAVRVGLGGPVTRTQVERGLAFLSHLLERQPGVRRDVAEEGERLPSSEATFGAQLDSPNDDGIHNASENPRLKSCGRSCDVSLSENCRHGSGRWGSAPRIVLVWDIFIRVFHWLIVALVAAAYATLATQLDGLARMGRRRGPHPGAV